MALTAAGVADYLSHYISEYRREYSCLVESPPRGGGYPSLEISPYLRSKTLSCWLASDGAVILDESKEPDYIWWIAGGPALMVDFPEGRTPPDVVSLLKEQGIFGKPIGIYRIVAKNGLPTELWEGRLGPVIEEADHHINETRIVVKRVEQTISETLQRLTFGAFGFILDIRLPAADSNFWVPHIIRRMGFITADRVRRRFVNYMEVLPHVDEGAWDVRSIFTRVQSDVRRDFAQTFGTADSGGLLSFGESQNSIQPFFDRLTRLSHCIQQFASLLTESPNATESAFHDFLAANPILLDVYAEPISKPRFEYPEGESPLGKAYVEPDFILKYPDRTYRLVELERPNKSIATQQGQPRAEVTQAYFQIAEWRDYIAHHYDIVKERFPGIATLPAALVVVSRTPLESFGSGRDAARYKELLRNQFQNVDFLTYDDLLERAQQAYTRLASLGIHE
jgi:hypothetical protein